MHSPWRPHGLPSQERSAITRPHRKSLAHSVRRALALRLAGAGLLLALILAGVAFDTQRRRIEETVLDRAQLAVELMNLMLLDQFDRDATPDRAAIEAVLDARTPDTRPHWTGHYPLVRVHDPSGRLLAERRVEGDEHMEAASRVLDARTPAIPGAGESIHELVRVDGHPYLYLALPLYDRQGNRDAVISGVFAVSDAAIASVRRGALETAGYVFGIVLVCTVLFFPLVNSLLGRLGRLTDNLLDSQLETLQITGSAIAKRDSDTDAHNYRVTILSTRLGKELGLRNGEMQTLVKGAFLHDVGKIGIRDAILLKPGRLDEDEFEIMKTHVDHGLDIVKRSGWLADASSVVGAHHEKFDGSGYPRGISAREIPLVARIFAVADVFDALSSKRPYKEAFGFEHTMQILEEGRGTHFDPAVLDAFGGIARELYEELAGMDELSLRRALDEINDQFFVREIEQLA